MAEKLIKCPVCGAEMASKAKSCPSCGAKNKKPVYKRWWFWVIAVFLMIGIIGSVDGGSDEQMPDTTENQKQDGTASDVANNEKEEITYIAHNVTELFDALNNNALNAQQTYKDQYVEITGYLGTIDSSGKYIGIDAGADNYDYLFSRMLLLACVGAAILAAVVVYGALVLALHCIRREDLELLPKGDKLARLLHVR